MRQIKIVLQSETQFTESNGNLTYTGLNLRVRRIQYNGRFGQNFLSDV